MAVPSSFARPSTLLGSRSERGVLELGEACWIPTCTQYSVGAQTSTPPLPGTGLLLIGSASRNSEMQTSTGRGQRPASSQQRDVGERDPARERAHAHAPKSPCRPSSDSDHLPDLPSHPLQSRGRGVVRSSCWAGPTIIGAEIETVRKRRPVRHTPYETPWQTAFLQLAVNPLVQRVPAERTTNCFWDPESGTKIDQPMLFWPLKRRFMPGSTLHMPAMASGARARTPLWDHIFVQKRKVTRAALEGASTVCGQVAAHAHQVMSNRLVSVGTRGLDRKKHCEAVSPLTQVLPPSSSNSKELYGHRLVFGAASLPEPHAQGMLV